MKINKNNNRKKSLTIGTVVGVMLLSAVALVTFYLNNHNAQTSAPSKEESSAGNAKKLETLEQVSSEAQSDATSNSSKAQNDSPTDSTSTSAMRITAKNQNGSLYQIRAIVDVVETGGKCTLVMTNSSSTVTKESETQPLAQSTTCRGFDIPINELRQGTWSIQISYISGDTSADISDVIEVK